MATGNQRPAPARPVPFACIRGLDDAAALERVYRLCGTLTPRIERHLEVFVLDLGGSERLALGEGMEAEVGAAWLALGERLAERIQADEPGLRRRVRVGIGPTRTVAWLAATVTMGAGESRRAVLPEQVARFLAPLPLALLVEVPDLAGVVDLATALEALALSGIGMLGQLRRLTPLALQRRFGPFGASIATVAAGHDLRPLRVERPDEWTGIRLRCEPVLRTEQLLLAIEPLAEHVALTLLEWQQAAGAVALILSPDVGEPVHSFHDLSHRERECSARSGATVAGVARSHLINSVGAR